jgi:hypothetical protein
LSATPSFPTFKLSLLTLTPFPPLWQLTRVRCTTALRGLLLESKRAAQLQRRARSMLEFGLLPDGSIDQRHRGGGGGGSGGKHKVKGAVGGRESRSDSRASDREVESAAILYGKQESSDEDGFLLSEVIEQWQRGQFP